MISRTMLHLPTMFPRYRFAEFERVAHDMDRWTRAMFGRPDMRRLSPKVFPAVNITENDDRYVVHAELPGIKADDIELQVDGRKLTISGERNIRSEDKGARYHRREREAGRFSRVIGLPGDVDADSVDAKMVNGVLMVQIPKSAAAKPKRITVH